MSMKQNSNNIEMGSLHEKSPYINHNVMSSFENNNGAPPIPRPP